MYVLYLDKLFKNNVNNNNNKYDNIYMFYFIYIFIIIYLYIIIIILKGLSEAIFIENDGVSTILAGYEDFYKDPEYCKQMTCLINGFFYESK